MKLLPTGVIADTLNQKARRVERSHRTDDKVPMIHVSSLIKSSTQDVFCPREFVLRHMERRIAQGAGIPPKFELLYGVGHFYGDYVVRKFLERNPEWAQYAWGDWTCVCGETLLKRTHLPRGHICNKCGHPANLYRETDLFNPRRTVIGHADLLFAIPNGDELFFYVYEFKSIERQDVDFDRLARPLGDHVVQASNYYYMLKAEGFKVSRRIRFVYIDRSLDGLYTKQPFKELSARAIPKRRLANFYRRADACHKAIEKKKLPPRLCDEITCARAKQCSVAVSCFNRTKDRIKRIALV